MKLVSTLCISTAVALLACASGSFAADTAATPATPAASATTATTPAAPAKAKVKAKAKAPAKKTHGKKSVTGAKAVPVAPVAVDDGEDEGAPDISTVPPLEYACEMGNKLTIYHLPNDDNHIALRWGKTIHRLTKVNTSTGAHRYENKKYGLVWIGIPAKGMLLDSRGGHQLANECKSKEELGELAVTPQAQ